MIKNDEIETSLKTLIYDIKHGDNGIPTKYAIDILNRYKNKYNFVKEYLDESFKN